jgi:hypothetical protein
MSRSTIGFFALFSGFTAMEIAAWVLFRSNPDMISAPAVAVHCAAACGAALAGCWRLRSVALSARIALALLFLLLAAVLPVAGIPLVAALSAIFASSPGDGLRPEDRYVFGNPSALAARRESRHPAPDLMPLCESMRLAEAPHLQRMVHGLRFLQPKRQTLHFLQRYQSDSQSDLQFAAQGVIAAAVEQLEHQLQAVTRRLEENPLDDDAHTAAAEILLELAEWAPEGDATAGVYRKDALAHLQKIHGQDADNDARICRLRTDAQLALRGGPGTSAAARLLAKIPGFEDAATLAEAQAAFCRGDWHLLPAAAAKIHAAPADFAEPLAFWAGPLRRQQIPAH